VPLDSSTLNVADAQFLIENFLAVRTGFGSFANDVSGTLAILKWNAGLEKTRAVNRPISLPANVGEPAIGGGISAKSMASSKVCKIANQVLNRICLIFQSGGNGEPLATGKETKNNASASGSPFLVDKTQSIPGFGR